MNKKYLLQIGLAFTLLYAGIDSLVHPSNWIGFVPAWIEGFKVSAEFVLQANAILEIILGILFIVNRLVRPAAIIAAASMVAIILSGGFGTNFLITFRDVGLFFMALYLAFNKPSRDKIALQ